MLLFTLFRTIQNAQIMPIKILIIFMIFFKDFSVKLGLYQKYLKTLLDNLFM